MLPATRTDSAHDHALQSVVDRLTGGLSDRADTPDGWVTAVRRMAPRAAEHAPFPEGVEGRLRRVLAARGIEQLYTHQAAAVDHALAGRNVVITTPTASGKTLCYNAPVLSAILRDPSARALYLFPTKALAQDQLAELHELSDQLSRLAELEIGVFTYDGDTPQDARRAIRGRAHVVLSNPDMLHSGILPHHPRWAKLFENLRYVVIDELHAYRGVFGSHLANVLRRMRRICRHYGSNPAFICSSATIANPKELAEALVEQPFELVSESGAPRGEKFFLFVNPPVVNQQLGIRRSYLAETRRVASEFLKRQLQLIVFAQSRLTTEILTTYLKDDFGGQPGTQDQIRGYRGGYLPQRRREIEKGLREGSVRAVVSTNALELGIDIGALDAAVCVTFPGTVASLRQMWGRAGRRGRGLAVYVAGEDALDQFFCRHPDEFLERPVEAAIVWHENEPIHLAHLLCAAHEGPLTAADAETLGPRWQAYADLLVSQGDLVERRGQYLLRHPEDYPAARVSLRSASPDSVAVIDVSSGELLGTVESSRAANTIHDGAVYLHLGRSYEVRELDLDARRALVDPFDGNWYTQPKRETDMEIERLLDRREALGVTLSFGQVTVTEQVHAYQRKRLPDHEVIDLNGVDLPPHSFTTQALWYELGEDLLQEFPHEVLLGALHAAEHTQIAVLPLLAMCDRWDIGGLSTNFHPQTGRPTIFIYDGHPGGVGITLQGFRNFDVLVEDAHRLISECPCESGCPSCVQSPKCGNLNEPLSKAGALEVMGRMLQR
jgi:DEAD/DEAH box helicase domain-containing protein